MKQLIALAAAAALLSGCDFVGGVDVDPVAFSSITVTDSPLPVDEDGSPVDLYVELQDAGGRAIYQGPLVENADRQTVLPYVIATDGELLGSTRGYYVVVMDRDDDGYDLVMASTHFTAEDLRSSSEPVYQVASSNGRLVAEIAITR
jgi:hypothetical protein